MSSLILANVSWTAPDGTSLFSDLNFAFGHEHVGLVGRNGTGKTTLLRMLAGEIEPSAGSITRTARVGYLPQSLETRPDDRIADLFGVGTQLACLRRIEKGEASEQDLNDADWTLEIQMEQALLQVGLAGMHPDCPLSSLSGGQRTRAALAALFFVEPDILLLDEPTNHLDQQGRHQIMEALGNWQGGVVLASHDRTLLAQMDAIIELSSLGAKRYGGNYEIYRQQKLQELEVARQSHAQAERHLTEIRRRTQQASERKARTDRKGKALRASGSQPKILMDAARERSEKSGGAGARLRDKREDAAHEALDQAQKQIEILEPLRMDIPPSGLVTGRHVLAITDLAFSFSGDVPVFENMSLDVSGPERIAIEGPNGAGKSTLLSCIMGEQIPEAGSIALHVPIAMLDQDVRCLVPDQTVQENFARLDPKSSENERRAVLARFGFRGRAADRQINTLSGGQKMRAGLACTLGSKTPPQLLLLDEPNNHLDIEATEILEAALRDYDGAILVISHDVVFLERIGIERTLRL